MTDPRPTPHPPPDLIGVTGAPGNVGTPLVRELLRRGARVRVLARRPEVARQALADVAAQVEFAPLTFGERPTYARALQGLDRLFVLRPPQLSRVTRDLVPALDVALGAGVRHFALLSLQGADRLTVTPHAQLEAYLRGTGADWTFLRPGFFLQNLSTTHLPELRRGELAVPAGQGRTSFVDVRDVAEAAAVVLTEAGHAGRAYELTGPQALTYGELAEVFSGALGRPVRYTNPSPLAFFRLLRARGVPPAQILVMEAIYATARFGLAAHVSQDLPQLLGRPARTAQDFAHDLPALLQGDTP
ncbi:SDR family oxidoreductase [Deinococcus multiflagellatus]|uniref:SDR family oxidoreductase n=1 Tax=Deinococcus multiflagellatus TaxID=1656887 RepID=A0ABW1ZIC5_9DEIO|nr:SDR family oxidoreductase [Deinococcus multiflagellatus]MBZ9711750.1 SDR family oxidoreductase [Deinococcus multiflagellatus]